MGSGKVGDIDVVVVYGDGSMQMGRIDPTDTWKAFREVGRLLGDPDDPESVVGPAFIGQEVFGGYVALYSVAGEYPTKVLARVRQREYIRFVSAGGWKNPFPYMIDGACEEEAGWWLQGIDPRKPRK